MKTDYARLMEEETPELAVRKFERIDPDLPVFGYFELCQELTGEFPNREEFQVKNISMGGFNLMSNFPPVIGDTYRIHVRYGGDKHAFRVKIVHSRILRFQTQPEGVFRLGVVYATGCQILFDSEFQKRLILGIIENDCRTAPAAITA